tara:strand:+ start:1940 stop:2227 length:288 start_codon:yes stop_codon:yes gene_type:complete
MKSQLLQEVEDTVRQQLKHDKDIINAAAENMSGYANSVIETDIATGKEYADKIRQWATTNVTLSSNDAYHELVHLTEMIDTCLDSIQSKIRRLHT